MVLGYLGPQYTFSYKAAKLYCEQIPALCLTEAPALSFYALFGSLELPAGHDGYFDKIIVPIENSIEGNIPENFDLLKKKLPGIDPDNPGVSPALCIESEVILPIQEYLIGCDCTEKTQITDILSHPQPLAHCRTYLQRQFPNVVKVETLSTTTAALIALGQSEYQIMRNQILSYAPDKKHCLAVIGDSELVNIDPARLTILDREISDHPTNATRFLVIGREQLAYQPGVAYKTSIIVSAQKDEPGGLYRILGEFATRHINLTKIESRPTKEELGDYLFFIDFIGHLMENDIADVLNAIRKYASFFKILGSYKKDNA